MKHYAFPIFITALLLLTGYTFYTVWHDDEVDVVHVDVKKQKKYNEQNLSDKKIIAKENLIVPKNISPQKSSVGLEENSIVSEMKEMNNVPNLTPKQIEAQTQEVYESLMPDSQDETIEEATIAFENLDERVDEITNKLAEEMHDVEESQASIEPIDQEEEQVLEEEASMNNVQEEQEESIEEAIE